MHNCFALSEKILVKLKRKFQISGQSLNYKQIELEEICRPCAIHCEPVCPADIRIIRQFFTVIHMILRHALTDGLILTKHEQPGYCQPLNSAFAVPPPTAQFFKQLAVIFAEPRMIWFM